MATKRKTETNIGFSNAAAAVPARRKSVSKPRTNAVASEANEVIESVVTAPEGLPVSSVTIVIAEPSREAIAALAYSFWAARGYQGGSEQEDWLRAELQLRAAASN